MANNIDVKRALKAHGHTIKSVATELGITQSALSQCINNDTISLQRVCDIASVLHISINEFIASCTADNSITINCPHCGQSLTIIAN